MDILADTSSLRSTTSVVTEGVVARCGRVDGTNHVGETVRRRRQLLAEEPDRVRVVCDGEVPFRNWGQARVGEEHPARVEASSHGSAWIVEGRLRDGVVSGHPRESEVDNSAVCCGDIIGDELEDSTWSILSGANLDSDDVARVLSKSKAQERQGGDSSSKAHFHRK